jgi:hypothetical protein
MPELRTSIIKQTPRFTISANRVDGILNYDSDNCYPQRVAEIIYGSAVAAKCADVYAKFIAGQGFEDKQFYTKIINPKGQTVDNLLRKVANDLALYRGFALHVNYNANGKITAVSHIPFEHCRICPPDEYGYVRKIAVYDDWAKKRSRQLRRDTIDFIDVFNPDPTAINAQNTTPEHWQQYKGQIYWYSADGVEYPLATPDPVLEDCITDAEIKAYKLRAITTNFMASHVYVHRGYFETDEAREDMHTVLNTFQGSNNAGKIMMVESPTETTDPKILKVDVQDFDKQFEYTEKSVQDNIRLCFGIPSVLIGKEVAGKLGSSQEIEQAVNYYSYQTMNERLILEETFLRIFSLSAFPLNPSNNYTIKPLSYDITNLSN